jgi:hypothetical protein
MGRPLREEVVPRGVNECGDGVGVGDRGEHEGVQLNEAVTVSVGGECSGLGIEFDGAG